MNRYTGTMVIVFLFACACIGIGRLTTKLIPLSFFRLERYAITVFLGIFVSTWILFLGSWLIDFKQAPYLVIILGALAYIGDYFLKGKKDRQFEQRRNSPPYSYLAAFLLFKFTTKTIRTFYLRGSLFI